MESSPPEIRGCTHNTKTIGSNLFLFSNGTAVWCRCDVTGFSEVVTIVVIRMLPVWLVTVHSLSRR